MNEYLDDFMSHSKYEGLTFDDVSLVTQYADFLPDNADVSSQLTRNIRINIPFLSAAMDTVTDGPMATAMALLGGIGIIHKNLTPKRQARAVNQVKHHLHGLIRRPVTFRENQTVAELEAIRDAGHGRTVSRQRDPRQRHTVRTESANQLLSQMQGLRGTPTVSGTQHFAATTQNLNHTVRSSSNGILMRLQASDHLTAILNTVFN